MGISFFLFSSPTFCLPQRGRQNKKTTFFVPEGVFSSPKGSLFPFVPLLFAFPKGDFFPEGNNREERKKLPSGDFFVLLWRKEGKQKEGELLFLWGLFLPVLFFSSPKGSLFPSGKK